MIPFIVNQNINCSKTILYCILFLCVLIIYVGLFCPSCWSRSLSSFCQLPSAHRATASRSQEALFLVCLHLFVSFFIFFFRRVCLQHVHIVRVVSPVRWCVSVWIAMGWFGDGLAWEAAAGFKAGAPGQRQGGHGASPLGLMLWAAASVAGRQLPGPPRCRGEMPVRRGRGGGGWCVFVYDCVR